MKCFLVSNNLSETGFELEIWIQLASLFAFYLHSDFIYMMTDILVPNKHILPPVAQFPCCCYH